jgi:hypothetical protein
MNQSTDCAETFGLLAREHRGTSKGGPEVMPEVVLFQQAP